MRSPLTTSRQAHLNFFLCLLLLLFSYCLHTTQRQQSSCFFFKFLVPPQRHRAKLIVFFFVRNVCYLNTTHGQRAFLIVFIFFVPKASPKTTRRLFFVFLVPPKRWRALKWNFACCLICVHVASTLHKDYKLCSSFFFGS